MAKKNNNHLNTRDLQLPGLTIACKIWGNPENPPIVALHGWLDNANSFDPLASYLQEHFYIIAVDLPGHGYSAHLPPSSHYHFIDGLFIVVQIIKALQLDKVHLLGHSMGACLASMVGGLAPNLLLSISLIEGLGPFSHPEDSAYEQITTYLKHITQQEFKKAKGYPHFEDAALARSLKGYVSLEIAQILCQRGLVKKHGLYYWRHDKRLLAPTPLRLTERQILSCISEISVKTCLIWASKGFSFDSKLMQERIKTVKHLKIAHFDGGHHIHMEQPERIGQFLADFYRSL